MTQSSKGSLAEALDSIAKRRAEIPPPAGDAQAQVYAEHRRRKRVLREARDAIWEAGDSAKVSRLIDDAQADEDEALADALKGMVFEYVEYDRRGRLPMRAFLGPLLVCAPLLLSIAVFLFFGVNAFRDPEYKMNSLIVSGAFVGIPLGIVIITLLYDWAWDQARPWYREPKLPPRKCAQASIKAN
ncbi:Yip1 family protein (plasmid) [Brevundimonas olei]|uniref:Yip1 family protein n=1 Tax=Brevundimonas olei TaxID=657642 RepID=A0ABZ2IG44_9CAUL